MRKYNCLVLGFIGLTLTGCAVGSSQTAAMKKTAPAVAAATMPDLNMFLNQDLDREVTDRVATLKAFLDGPAPSGIASLAKPWFVWKVNDPPHPARYVVFEGLPIPFIPGASDAVVHVLDSDQNELSSHVFSVGWRMRLRTANLNYEPEIGTWVIEIFTDPTRPRQDIPRRQIYAFDDSHIALIRLEDSKGEIMRNRYIYPNQTMGPDAPRRSADEWERRLNESDPIAILETLTWLAGVHLEPSQAGAPYIRDVAHEDIAEASTFQEVWQRAGVQRKLALLGDSRIEWIAQAARLAQIKSNEN